MKCISGIIVCFLGCVFNGITQEDTTQRLPLVTVSAFQLNVPWNEAPTNSSVIDSTVLNVNHGLSPQDALNSIPSVQFESRGVDGSRRISIRGSAIRSPFGVRNLKMYWNGIPISSPDGSSPFEIIDIQNLDGIEVVSGPTSSMYGAGMGGVILAKTNLNKNSASIRSVIGSWNTIRTGIDYNFSSKKLGVKISGIIGSSDGYRKQEFNDKKQVTIAAKYKANEQNSLSLLTNIYEGVWGLPGAIDSAQVGLDPREASEYAIENNTQVERKRLRIGVSHTWKGTFSELNTSIYVNSTSKVNPFGTSAFFNGYKQENGKGTGGRSVWTGNWRKDETKIQVNAGLEFQWDDNQVVESDLIEGNAGDQRSDVNTTALNSIAFADLRLNRKKFGAQLGVSYTQLKYTISGFGSNHKFQTRAFSPVWSPSMRLSRKVSKDGLLFFTMGTGYNAPSVWDLQQVNDSVNNVLNPEVGLNTELGIKWKLRKFVRLQLVGFNMVTKNAIISTQLPDLSFELRNAGVTDQWGLETQLIFDPIDWKHWTFSGKISYSLSKYKFKEYTIGVNDFSGNFFPGVAQHRGTGVFSVESPIGIGMQLTSIAQTSTFLNNSNTDVIPGYTRVNGKLNYTLHLKRRIKIQAYYLMVNATNVSYTSFLQTNGFGGRYFNPAAARSHYFGINVSYTFK